MAQTSRADDDRSEFRTNLSLIKNVRDRSDVESWRRFHDFYAPLLMRYLRRLGLEEDRRTIWSRMCSSGCCRRSRRSSSTASAAGSAATSGS